MPTLMKGTTPIGALTTDSANLISYDGTNSGLAATDVQDAIDEVVANMVSPIIPNYSNVIDTITTAGSTYVCPRDGYLIGNITGASNGWASIRESSQNNYFLALDTSAGSGATGVCIPFKKGSTIVLGNSGTYSLAFTG